MGPGVWVYLPLPVARALADQTLAKLKAGGIDDALKMPGPNEGPGDFPGSLQRNEAGLRRELPKHRRWDQSGHCRSQAHWECLIGSIST